MPLPTDNEWPDSPDYGLGLPEGVYPAHLMDRWNRIAREVAGPDRLTQLEERVEKLEELLNQIIVKLDIPTPGQVIVVKKL